MAVIVFPLPSAAALASPAARTSAANPKATDSVPSRRFDHLLGDEQHRQQAPAKADGPGAADASSDATPAAKSGKPAAAKDSRKPGDGDDDGNDNLGDTGAAGNDPRSLLGWLQGQVPAPPPAAAATPLAGTPAATDPASNPAAVFALTAIAKNLPRPGDTPPTQAPGEPAAAALTGAAANASDGGLAAAFGVAQSGSGDSKDGSARASGLTPALSAALTAVVANTSATAAPELVARGVEQFQALLARSDAGAAPPVAAAPATVATTVPAAPLAVDSPDLPARLGERLQWLVDGGVQEARIQLHPRELGTVNVQVRIEARGASVWFAAEHPAARAALESALPQLRERFAGEGVNLAQTQVTTQTGSWNAGSSQQQSQSQSQSSSAASFFGSGGPDAGDEIADASSPVTARAIVHIGLLDRYA